MSDLMICRFTYYPRKGTITEYFFLKLDHFTHCNLSPQGDDNASVANSVSKFTDCNLSPQGDDNLK